MIKRNSKARRASWLTALSAASMLCGAALLAFYGSSLALAARANGQGLEAFESARSKSQAVSALAAEPSRVAIKVAGAPDQSDWSEKRIKDYEALRSSGGLDEVPAGILRIPSIGLELPLYEGTDEFNLTRGAGIIEGTAALGSPGNTGLAAHRDGYFRSLKSVSVGDIIHVETLDAELRYRIAEILIVDPADTFVLDPGERSLLTLVTCYPFYFVGSAPQRYIVQAEII